MEKGHTTAMNGLKLLPVIISFLLLSAHFYRAGQVILAVLCIALPVLLVFKEAWVARVIQITLILGALEWLRTAWYFVQIRMDAGQPWTRLAIILGAVALFTALSALVFRAEKLRIRFGLKGPV
jgi:hypothetical protein